MPLFFLDNYRGDVPRLFYFWEESRLSFPIVLLFFVCVYGIISKSECKEILQYENYRA